MDGVRDGMILHLSSPTCYHFFQKKPNTSRARAPGLFRRQDVRQAVPCHDVLAPLASAALSP
jgi:hypothetical protein